MKYISLTFILFNVKSDTIGGNAKHAIRPSNPKNTRPPCPSVKQATLPS